MISLVKRLGLSNAKKELKKLTFTLRKKILHDASQSGEVGIIKKLIKDNNPPYMVDVGANDGKTYSNSYFFVKRLGWNAIMIEPYPDAFESLKKTHAKNPRVICLKIACSNTIGRQKLFIGVSNLLSTLCQDENDCFKVHRTTKTIDVETETLTNVLRENNFPKDISLLLIDTEGMDYEVLLGLDFEQYQPRIVVTEEYCWNMEKHRNKYQYLLNSRYSLYKRLGSNTIWIRSSDSQYRK